MKFQPKSFICTTDFSDFSKNAISYGIALAKEFRAKLYLCYIIDKLSDPWMNVFYADTQLHRDYDEAKIRAMDEIQQDLKQLIGDQAIDSEPFTAMGDPVEEITRMAHEKKVDMVISASHGWSGMKRVVLGSFTKRLMRKVGCPLLVVRGSEDGAVIPLEKEPRFQRILVGCDFSENSNVAFQYGLGLAQQLQAELHLAHVIKPYVYRDMFEPQIKIGEKNQQDMQKLLEEELSNMAPKEVLNWCTLKTALLAGQPYKELIKYALLQKIDLIVLGVRGYSIVDDLFVGSTTDRVIRKAPCPVLSVPSIAQDA